MCLLGDANQLPSPKESCFQWILESHLSRWIILGWRQGWRAALGKWNWECRCWRQGTCCCCCSYCCCCHCATCHCIFQDARSSPPSPPLSLISGFDLLFAWDWWGEDWFWLGVGQAACHSWAVWLPLQGDSEVKQWEAGICSTRRWQSGRLLRCSAEQRDKDGFTSLSLSPPWDGVLPPCIPSGSGIWNSSPAQLVRKMHHQEFHLQEGTGPCTINAELFCLSLSAVFSGPWWC